MSKTCPACPVTEQYQSERKTFHMICDLTAQFDIRKVTRIGFCLPDMFEFAGGILSTTWTSTNFGGRRQWFLCPTCGRRCAIIYCHSDTLPLGCQVCLKGRYLSERLSFNDRKLHKALKVRRRLGQKQGGIVAPFPVKPKGMHWRTYNSLKVDALNEELKIWLEGLRYIRRYP